MSFLNKLKKNIGIEKQENKEEEDDDFEEQEIKTEINKKKKIKIKESKEKIDDDFEENDDNGEEDEDEEEPAVAKVITSKKKKKKIKPVIAETTIDKSEDISLEEKLGKEKGELAIDVYQTDKDIVIQSAIAGINPEDLDITIEDDVLVIKGKRAARYEERDKNYYYQECYWGEFLRRIILPEEVDSSSVEAELKQGILTIKIPKIEKKKKKIVVKG